MSTAVPARTRAFEPLAVMLYGEPGSGKGTLGRVLSQITSWPHISTGDLLRKHIATGTAAGRASEGILAGGYAPDEVVNQIVMARMQQGDCRHGVILDGYPRTVLQTSLLLPLLDECRIAPAVVRLRVDYNEMSRRLRNRRTCPVCGAIFNLETIPPQRPGLCDSCAVPLVERSDDNPEYLDRRLEQFTAWTAPVETLLRERVTRWVDLEVARQPEEIARELLKRLLERPDPETKA